ncbi:MAG: hypothetical protein RL885_29580 [Planctomycetota bacterium]
MRRCRIGGLLIAVILVGPVVWAQGRTPTPSDEDVNRQLVLVEAMYADRLEPAESQPEKAGVAEEMIERSRRENEDMALAYALLHFAHNLSMTARSESTALAAVSELTERFQVDFARVRIAAVRELMTYANLPSDRRRYLRYAMGSLGIARYNADWPAVEQLLEFVQELAKGLREPRIKERIAWMAANAKELESNYGDYLEALDAIRAEEPTSDHFYLAGRYEGFLQGDWRPALPKLVQGSNKAVAETAAAAMRDPEPVQERLAIADKWWMIREGETLGAQWQLERLAESWYRDTLADLEGQARRRVEKRLLEIFPVPSLPEEVRPVEFGESDWQVRCWSDQRWKVYDLDKVTARVRSGVLDLRNTSGVYYFSRIVYGGAFLDGDFVISFDFRGQPHEILIVPDDEHDHAIGIPLEPASGWRRAVLSRQSGQVRVWVDGRPHAMYFQGVNERLRGRLGLSVKSDALLLLRNLRMEGVRPR